jgi:hypothetical protein
LFFLLFVYRKRFITYKQSQFNQKHKIKMKPNTLESLFLYCSHKYTEAELHDNRMPVIRTHIKIKGDIDNYHTVERIKKLGSKRIKTEQEKSLFKKRNSDYGKASACFRSTALKLFPLSDKKIGIIDLTNESIPIVAPAPIMHPIVAPIIAPIIPIVAPVPIMHPIVAPIMHPIVAPVPIMHPIVAPMIPIIPIVAPAPVIPIVAPAPIMQPIIAPVIPIIAPIVAPIIHPIIEPIIENRCVVFNPSTTPLAGFDSLEANIRNNSLVMSYRLEIEKMIEQKRLIIDETLHYYRVLNEAYNASKLALEDLISPTRTGVDEIITNLKLSKFNHDLSLKRYLNVDNLINGDVSSTFESYTTMYNAFVISINLEECEQKKYIEKKTVYHTALRSVRLHLVKFNESLKLKQNIDSMLKIANTGLSTLLEQLIENNKKTLKRKIIEEEEDQEIIMYWEDELPLPLPLPYITPLKI